MTLLEDTHIWYAFSFAVFLVLALKFGKSTILARLDEKISKIKHDIQEAENLHTEAQEMLAQYQRKHRDALKEAEVIINTAKNHAQKQVDQAEEDLRQNMARREQQLNERLQNMEQSVKKEIQNYAAELAINAATQIIADKLDKKTDQKLLDQAIKNVGAIAR